MSSKAQRLVYIGLEAEAGTGVTVDTALRALAELKPMPDKIKPDENIGSFAPARHYIGSLKAEGSLTMDGYYEHAHYPVSMALGAGAVVATGDPEVWTFTIPDATADTFATYTMEYSDGADHIIHATDVFATELEISGEAGKSWMIKPKLVGANVTIPAAVGASPTPPAGTAIKMADTILTIDDTFAGIGTTPVAELISFTWKLSDLQHQKLFAGVLYPSGRGNDKFEITLELVVEVEVAEIAAEIDKILTTDQSAIRIKATAADAGGEGIDWTMAINGNYMLDEIDNLDDRDGNNIIKLTYKLEKDSSDNTGTIVVENAATAL